MNRISVRDALAGKPLHLLFCGGVLMFFAVAKLGTVVARWIGLLPPVPSSDLADHRLMLWAGIVELTLIVLMFSVLSARRSCQLLTLIGFSFLAYRYVMHHERCPCMGAAPDLIPWLRLNERIVLLIVPYLLLLLGLWGWAFETVNPPRSSIRGT